MPGLLPLRKPNMKPQISVLMPSLNQGEFLEAAVASVFSQEVDDLELVVVDGGSADGSPSQLAALAARYPGRLRWQCAPDGGPAQAVNAAARLATAPVLGWLNADDLYEPGAVRRALDHLAANPDHVMVYGQARHADLAGTPTSPYPTRGPETPRQAFAQGCFICQPSAFVRRDAWVAIGGLDERLRTAFDFDLWLRIFGTWPGRIGFIDTWQARSRLHPGGITHRLREQVAREGLAVLRRHLGQAPPEWLLTHGHELAARHPFEPEPTALKAEIQRVLQAAAPDLGEAGVRAVQQHLAQDRALELATPYLHVGVQPDGWAGPVLELRVRQPPQGSRSAILRCRHARPGGGRLRVEVAAPDGCVRTVDIETNGPFEIELPLTDRRHDARMVFRLMCLDCFVPAECDAGSSDRRVLGYVVEAVSLLAIGPTMENDNP